MGRYYNGDIEGKFWFAVQSSDAADRFGKVGSEPNYISYYYDDENLEEIDQEIKLIEEDLGEVKNLFDEFFEENNGYNDEMLKNFFDGKGLNLTEREIKQHLSDYADLGLGIKIRDCVKETGSCSFDAEY
jgi:hypothetical protein